MWKQILNTEYFLVYNNDYEIYVTDYVGIWFCNFSAEHFLSCLKDSNDGLEMEDKDFFAKGRLLLTNLECLKNARIKLDGNILMMTLSTTTSFGYPFRIDMKLVEGSKELFFQKVTLSLLKAVNDLRSSERELRDLLLKKDKELAEYKDEKGQIVFRSLKTEPFQEQQHMNKHTQYQNNFGDTEIPACVLEKTQAGISVPKIEEDISTKLAPNPINQQLSVTKTEVEDVKMDHIMMHHRAIPSKRQRRKLNL